MKNIKLWIANFAILILSSNKRRTNTEFRRNKNFLPEEE